MKKRDLTRRMREAQEHLYYTILEILESREEFKQHSYPAPETNSTTAEEPINCLLVGDENSGKSCFIQHVTGYRQSDTYEPTGAPTIHQIEVAKHKISLNLYDTPGKERWFQSSLQALGSIPDFNVVVIMYNSIEPVYKRGSNSQQSEGITLDCKPLKWYKYLQPIIEERKIPVLFVGNKMDISSTLYPVSAEPT